MARPRTWVDPAGVRGGRAADGRFPPWQALPNGAPAASKPGSPALIETKEPNGSVHTSGSASEEPEDQDAQVCARQEAGG